MTPEMGRRDRGNAAPTSRDLNMSVAITSSIGIGATEEELGEQRGAHASAHDLTQSASTEGLTHEKTLGERTYERVPA